MPSLVFLPAALCSYSLIITIIAMMIIDMVARVSCRVSVQMRRRRWSARRRRRSGIAAAAVTSSWRRRRAHLPAADPTRCRRRPAGTTTAPDTGSQPPPPPRRRRRRLDFVPRSRCLASFSLLLSSRSVAGRSCRSATEQFVSRNTVHTVWPHCSRGSVLVTPGGSK